MLLAHGADPNAQNDGGSRCRRPIGTAIAPCRAARSTAAW
jgi:hypothetical protein